MTEPITGSQLRAAILEIKSEVLEAIHATEARIVEKLDTTTTALDHRVSETERQCTGCRAAMEVRMGALEQNAICRYHSTPKDRNGNGKASLAMLLDPKLFTGLAIFVATLVWLLVERILPLLRQP